MARLRPQSQTREVMTRKREIARELLARGLSVSQITVQLNCSAHFVRAVRAETQICKHGGHSGTQDGMLVIAADAS